MADPNLLVVADLLLGAAYADGTGDGTEILAVRDLLREIVGDKLPEDLEKRVADFSPEKFDVDASAKAFLTSPKITPRKLVELIASVRDADEEIDLAEDEYLRKVGKAVGLKDADYADLAVDFEMEDLRAAFVSKPPPPPKK